MENHDRVVLAVLEILLHALKVEALALCMEIPIRLSLVANDVGDVSMDRPGVAGNEQVDVLVRVPLGQEAKAET